MARSCTTFPPGRGRGYGGPATGPGWGAGAGPARPFGAHYQPAPEAKSAGKEVAALVRARVMERAEELLAAQFERALSLQHPQGHQAAKDLLDRILPPVQRQELAGADCAAIGFFISGEPEMTEAEWVRIYGAGA